ncbi:MAG TPA: metallophosphoesterase [Casimicrobiaceae bacterium]|nr:metallophosphoesterase [Casimicrobiaceae bacterium]
MLVVLVVLHAYIGVRLLPDVGTGNAAIVAGSVLLALSAFLIPRGVRARRATASRHGARVAWAGLVAMGAFSTLFVLTFLRDVGLAIALTVAALTPVAVPMATIVHASALAVPAITALVTAVGYLNARRVAAVRRVDVPIDTLPQALHGFTIAQITDLHVGPTIGRDHVEAIVVAVNELGADMVAITGDLVDGSVRQLASQIEPLTRLASRHGTFFVTGNHEYYSGAHAWLHELRRLGLNVLMNEHVVVEHDGAELVVAGVTDYGAHHFDPSHRSDPAAAIDGAPPSAAAKVLLAHQPRSAIAAAEAGFHLQLSGHTHGGQFLPWNWFVRLQQPFTAGLDRLDRLWVYTSRGTGYWGPPKRFGAPSEITCLRLVAA